MKKHVKQFFAGFAFFLIKYFYVGILWSMACWCFDRPFSAKEAFGIYIASYILLTVAE